MTTTDNKIPEGFPFNDDKFPDGYEPPELISYDYTIPEDEKLTYETDKFQDFIENAKKKAKAREEKEKEEEEEKAKAKAATPPPQPTKIEVVQNEPSPVRIRIPIVPSRKRFSQDSTTPPLARTPSPTPPESSPWENSAFTQSFEVDNPTPAIQLFATFLLKDGIPVWDPEKYKRIYGVNRNDNRIRILSALFTKSIYMNPLNGSYDWNYSVFQYSALGTGQKYENALPSVGQSAKYSGISQVQTMSQSRTETQVFFANLDYFATIRWASTNLGKQKITAINMGNPTSPGAGWDLGYEGLEADIFMRTNISSSLSNYLYPIGMYESIYTPDVTLIRAEQKEGYRFLRQDEKIKFDVVTASAVDCRGTNMNLEQNRMQLLGITRIKAANILENCMKHGSRILILGAFGCGIFENPPEIVAQAFSDAIQNYRGCFDYVFFPILNLNVYGPFTQAFAQASAQNFKLYELKEIGKDILSFDYPNNKK